MADAFKLIPSHKKRLEIFRLQMAGEIFCVHNKPFWFESSASEL
jgi:hypothetical protein